MITNDCAHGVGRSTVCQILFRSKVRRFIMVSTPGCSSSPGMLSTLADLPFFSVLTDASTSSPRIGYSAMLGAGGTFSISRFPVALWLCNSEQYSVHRSKMFCFPVRNSACLSRMVVVCSSLVDIKSLASGYAFSILFFVKLPSIPWQCSAIQFSFALFTYFVLVDCPVLFCTTWFFLFFFFLLQFSPSATQVPSAI